MVWADLFGPFDLATASAQVASIPCCLVLDRKALWDGLARNESSALGMKDREALALKRGLSSTSTDLRWVHSLAQLADCMTKDSEQGRTIFLSLRAHRPAAIGFRSEVPQC